MGIQDDRRYRGRHPDDRFGFAFQRGTRGLFLCFGCPQRCAAMEDVPRCGSHFRPDDILGGGQAVRGSQRRELLIHVRTAGVISTWKEEMTDEYSCHCPTILTKSPSVAAEPFVFTPSAGTTCRQHF